MYRDGGSTTYKSVKLRLTATKNVYLLLFFPGELRPQQASAKADEAQPHLQAKKYSTNYIFANYTLVLIVEYSSVANPLN